MRFVVAQGALKGNKNLPTVIVQVDAFTNEIFLGNPAAVCVLRAAAEENWMQNVAREMNLSETAFLYRHDSGGFVLRWFTPLCEVDLCGHATLASAHVLWEDGYENRNSEIRFETRSGDLRATLSGDLISLDLPSESEKPVTPPTALIEALGIEPCYVGRNRFDYLVEVDSEATLRGIKPDFIKLRRVETRGTIVTSQAETKRFDFVSRYFAPGVGINEDPVTGSSHCCLGPYWQRRLKKDTFTAFQASIRGGTVRIRMRRNERVLISGQAATVFRAVLTTP